MKNSLLILLFTGISFAQNATWTGKKTVSTTFKMVGIQPAVGGEKAFVLDSFGTPKLAVFNPSINYSNYVGANGTSAGIAGLVPSAIIGQQNSLLKGDGTWTSINGLQSIGNNVSIGNNFGNARLNIGLPDYVSTNTPDDIDMGNTYSNTALANPKIKLFNGFDSTYGFGVSDYQLDYIAPTGASHVFGIAGLEKFRINNNGNIGIQTATPTSTLEVMGSQANIPTIITSATSISNICYLQSQGLTTYLITLPTASSCAGRRYVIKNTEIAKTITAYNDNAGVSTTILPLGITILVSSGGVWEKFNN